MKHDPALDGLRGIAVLSVVLAHSGVAWTPGGGRGVDVFFVLSGYLITSLLKAEVEQAGRIAVAAFWRRRAVRLMPALLLMLAAYAVLGPVFLPGDPAERWKDIAFAAAYVTDYARVLEPSLSPIGHTWSLAIEEQFYLIWPFVVSGLVRLPRDTAVRLLVGLWVAITFGRIAILAVTHSWEAAYLPLHAHASGLVLGAMLPFLPRPPPLVGWAGLCGLFALNLFEPPGKVAELTWGISAAEACTAALIAGMGRGVRRLLAWRPLAALGLISYGVYLWHFPISLAVHGSVVQKTAVTLALSIGLAAVSYLTVERWARRFRDAKAPAVALA